MERKISLSKRLKLLTKSAKKRGIEVKLNTYFYKRLLEIGCIFCGQDLSDQGGYCLDRHDNTKGYIDDNVSPCCKFCNQAKGQQTPEEFFAWIKKAYLFQEKVRKSNQENLERDVKLYLKGKKVRQFNIKKTKAYNGSKVIRIKGKR